MTADEIEKVILREVADSYPTYTQRWGADRAAKQIAAAFRDKLQEAVKKAGPPAHYPSISCRCGAEVTGTNKHGPWCPVVTGERKR